MKSGTALEVGVQSSTVLISEEFSMCFFQTQQLPGVSLKTTGLDYQINSSFMSIWLLYIVFKKFKILLCKVIK